MADSEILTNMVLPENARSGRLSHAYIVTGGDTGRVVNALAAAAVCSGASPRPCGVCRDCVKAARGVHPDIIVTEAETGREFVVDKARAIRQDASIMPNEAARKAYIIKNADMMNKAAQNAMLKLLEEPPGGAVFILETPDPSALLSTVRSRCALLRTAPVATDTDGETEDHAEARELACEFIAILSGSHLELCALSFRLDKLDKAGLTVFLDEAERQAVEELKKTPSVASDRLSLCLRTVMRARDYVRQNVSAGHVSGMLLASLL